MSSSPALRPKHASTDSPQVRMMCMCDMCRSRNVLDLKHSIERRAWYTECGTQDIDWAVCLCLLGIADFVLPACHISSAGMSTIDTVHTMVSGRNRVGDPSCSNLAG